MTPAVVQQLLAIVLRHMSPDDCARLAAELRKRSRAGMARQQAGLIRAYRFDWCGDLTDRGAARQIERDLARFAESPLRNRVVPDSSDRRRADLFEILSHGPILGSERIRQILRAG
ncbi:hypothetical protein LJR220_001663 [Bradyrhizobium sp. LjRoot220]|uniref:hypothetical protein n=1 Tax=Bradyrhizobium sp. LjRoot220 TaxID=3342284 RepID=UPI003ECC6523